MQMGEKRNAQRSILWIIIIFFSSFNFIQGQSGITFEYLGPDTIDVGESCQGILDWGYPDNPVLGCTLPSCVTIDTTLTISGGYEIGDTVPLGTTVSIRFFILNNQAGFFDTTIYIYFGDIGAPVFDSLTLPPPTLSVPCASAVPAPPALGSVVANDFCSAIGDPNSPLTISFNENITLPDSCNGGNVERIWTATDAFGNASTFTQNITIEPDIGSPYFVVFPQDASEVCDSADFSAWVAEQMSIIQAEDDECGVLAYSNDAPPSFDANCDSTIVTFTAVDRCGNIAFTTATYSTYDDTPPSINTPAQTVVTFYCPTDPVFLDSVIQQWADAEMTAVDNCGTYTWEVNNPGFDPACSPGTGTADVVYYAIDNCGNADSIVIQFEVVDTLAPSVAVSPQDTTINCDTSTFEPAIATWLVNFGGIALTDNCSPSADITIEPALNGQTVTAAEIADTLIRLIGSGCEPSLEFDLVFTDLCGNSGSTQATIFLDDNQNPTWVTPPNDLVVFCEFTNIQDVLIQDWAMQGGGGAAIDNCGDVTYTASTGTFIPACGASGEYPATITAVDECGNETDIDAKVLIVDTNAPQIIVPGRDTTVECDANNQAQLNYWIDQRAFTEIQDACDTAFWFGLTYSTSTGESSDTITFGNYANYPTVPIGTCFWTVSVKFLFIDDCGNASSQQSAFFITDNTAPVITPPSDTFFTISCDLDPMVTDSIIKQWADNEIIASDNCGEFFWTENYSGLSTTCSPATGTTQVTYYVSDNCGNTDSITLAFEVIDTVAPLVVTPPPTVEIQCDATSIPSDVDNWFANYGGLVLLDNCTPLDDVAINVFLAGEVAGSAEVADSLIRLIGGSCGPSLEVTLEFTDLCGNTSSINATIALVDNQPPLWATLPSNLVIPCEQSIIQSGLILNWLNQIGGGGVAQDNCGSVSYSNNFVALTPLCGSTAEVLVTFTATDECGNESDTSAMIQVVDDDAPELTVEATDTVVDCGVNNQSQLNEWIDAKGFAQISDVCDTAFWVAFNFTTTYGDSGDTILFGDLANYPEVPLGACNWTLDAQFFFSDDCGNWDSATADFSITDNIPPQIVPPLDTLVLLSCSSSLSALDSVITNWAEDNLIASDNCGAFSWSNDFTNLNATCGPLTGEANVTYFALDDCGNADSISIQFEVVDTIAPQINILPQDTSIACDENTIPAAVTDWLNRFGGLEWSDNCTPVADVNITFSIDGMLLNQNEVIDSVLNLIGSSCAPSIEVTFIVSDPCGNETMAAASILLFDDEMPVWEVFPSGLIIPCVQAADQDSIVQDWLDLFGGGAAQDNCGAVTYTNDYSGLTPLCGNTAEATVVFTATDECGNTTDISADIRIVDNDPPFVTSAAVDTLVDCGNNNQSQLDAWLNDYAMAEIADQCDGAFWMMFSYTTSYGESGDSIFFGDAANYPVVPIGACDWTINVELFFTDDCGNTASTTAAFSITDNIPPQITPPTDTLVTFSCLPEPASVDSLIDQWASDNITAFDNCGAFNWTNDFTGLNATCSPATGDAFVTYYAMDDCGNTDSVSILFEFIDTVAPVLIQAPQDTSIACDINTIEDAVLDWLSDFANIELDDNCTATDEISIELVLNGMQTSDVAVADSLIQLINTTCGPSLEVVFRYSDLCGNVDSASATVFLVDDQDPVWTKLPSDLIIPCEQAAFQDSIVQDWLNLRGGGMADDNCGNIAFTNNYNGLTPLCGVTAFAEVAFTATDQCSNEAIVTAEVRIIDEIAPQLVNSAQDTLIECGNNNQQALNNWIDQRASAVFTDNCDAVLSVAFNYTANDGQSADTVILGGTGNYPLAPLASCDWSVEVEFIFSDDCGNASSSTASFSIADVTSPEIAPTNDTLIIFSCSEDPVVIDSIIQNWAVNELSATDNCNAFNWTNDYVGLNPTCSPATGEIDVTYFATDDCGNVDSVEIRFEVIDTEAPVILQAPKDTAINCDTLILEAAVSQWIDQQVIVVEDNCTDSPDILYELRLNGISVSATEIADSILSLVGTGCAATIDVEFYFEDLCGNNASTLASFSLIDNEPPSWVAEPQDLDIPCELASEADSIINVWLNDHGNGIAEDNCSNISFSDNYSGLTPACGNTAMAAVQFAATDDCGNEAVQTAVVRIVDETPPFVVVPAADTIIDCGTDNQINLENWLIGQAGAAISDACDTAQWLFFNYSASDGTSGDSVLFSDLSGFPVVPFEACNWTLTAQFVFTDDCGNTAFEEAIFSVGDKEPPQISPDTDTSITFFCPIDSISLDSAINNWAEAEVMVTDNCGNVTWSNDFTGLNQSCSPATGNARVLFVAADDCDNTDSVYINFQVVDTSPPTFIESPKDTIAECDSMMIEAAVSQWIDNLGGAVMTDNCTNPEDIKLKVRLNGFSVNAAFITDSLLNLIGQGCGPSISVEFNFADLCGNAVSTFADFNLSDSQPPTWSDLPQNLVIPCAQEMQADSMINDWLAQVGGGSAFDNCGNVVYLDSLGEFTVVCGGTESATAYFTAVDECGNETVETALVEIVDEVAPFIVQAANDTLIDCGISSEQALQEWIDSQAGAIANDVCDTAKWVFFSYFTSNGQSGDSIAFGDYANYPPIPTLACIWGTNVTFYVADDCGNTSSDQAIFNIRDTIAPVFEDIPDTLFSTCSTIPVAVQPMVTDNCDPDPEVTFEEISFPGDCQTGFSLLRIWTATDACGESTTVQQWVSAKDDTSPDLFGVPGDTVTTCDNLPALPQIGVDITAFDICDTSILITFEETSDQDPDPTQCGHYSYTIQRTWTAADDCDNTTALTQNITVIDTVAPTFTTPADITVSCELADNLDSLGTPFNIADDCDSAPTSTFNDDILAGACSQNYQVTRTWVVSDACGNASTGVQVINVNDLITPILVEGASDQTLSCTSDTELENAFQTWIDDHGGAEVVDNCGVLTWFAAVPGSYDINDPNTFPGIPAGGLDAADCQSPVQGIYRQENVDFVAYDECFNAVMTSAQFTVLDNTLPEIEQCPVDVTISTALNSCDTLLSLPVPLIMDNCSAELINVGPSMSGLELTLPISSAVPGDFQTPVDPVVFNFGPVPAPPVIAVDTATLTIFLEQVDAEGPTEYFEIIGEDGSVLGITNPSSGQCGNSTTTIQIFPDQINSWSQDGMITIVLEPNIPTAQPGSFSINDLCPAGPPTGGGGQATGSLAYTANEPINFRIDYSVNGEAPQSFDINTGAEILFQVGSHDIDYTIYDCAGNSNDCSFSIEVVDDQAPVIACFPDLSVAISNDQDCDEGVSVAIPYPESITDNCSLGVTFTQSQPVNLQDAFLSFAYDPNYLDFIAEDKNFTFTNVPESAAGAGVQLTINLQGDVENPTEYFNVVGEDNYLIGTTEVGQPNVEVIVGSCDTVAIPSSAVATYLIPTSLFNSWAADGNLEITLESNQDFGTPPPGIFGDGISPFCTFFPPDTTSGISDGLSTAEMSISFEQINTSYYATGATTIPPSTFPISGQAPVHVFNPGTSEVFFNISDPFGNTDTCSFSVTVFDTLSPVALCQPITVEVNPSGLDPYVLMPQEVDAGSYDNCEITSMSISEDTITCNQAGSFINVTLSVEDASGNQASCETTVNIKTLPPEPSFAGGLCENDSLFLFANPPATSAPNNNFYAYEWTGPPNNALVSDEENPVLSGVDDTNSGIYNVTVTGVTGCSSVAPLEIEVGGMPPVPELSVVEKACVGDVVTLTTQAYNGVETIYYWYEGELPNGMLVDSTFSAQIDLPPFLSGGSFTYYVEVKIDGCMSMPSLEVDVQVTDIPVAEMSNAPVIQECEGANIQLGTDITGPNITYEWTGPNGYFSTLQSPPALEDVDTIDSGVYFLTIFDDGCASIPDETVVLVNPLPEVPVIFGPEELCEGEDLKLVLNDSLADAYTWFSPLLTTFITEDPEIIISSVDSSHSGSWSVYATLDGCQSALSNFFNVQVRATPDAEANFDFPACEGADFQLQANSYLGAEYDWEGPDGFESLLQNPITPSVAGEYSVTITSGAGCADSATVEVEVTPAPQITAIGNTGVGCVDGNSEIELLATFFPPDPGDYSYHWTGPDDFESFDPTAIIPEGSAQDNGNYTLVVTSGVGCTSEEATTIVSVKDTPEPPSLSPIGPVIACEGDPLTLVTDNYPNDAVYTWNTPIGSSNTDSPNFDIDEVVPINGGEYNVFVTVDGCVSKLSPSTTVIVNPKPEVPSVLGLPNPVCVGDTLQLETKFFVNATYNWTGPAGFNGTVYNPVIYPVENIHQGSYSVQVTIEGCTSDFSEPAFVSVASRPNAPIIESNSPVCIDNADAELLLFVNPDNVTDDGQYTWFYSPNQSIIGGPSDADSLLLNDLSAYSPGEHPFYATLTNDFGCESATSEEITVIFDDIPAIEAFAGDDHFLCNNENIALNAEMPATGEGMWSQVGGIPVSITNPASPTSVVQGLQTEESYLLQWSLSNGACVNYDADTVLIDVYSDNQEPLAIQDMTLCDTTSIVLQAIAAQSGASGSWSQPNNQTNAGIKIVNPDSNVVAVNDLIPGDSYIFFWTLSNPGCGAFASDSVIVDIGSSDIDMALTTADFEICEADQVTLEAEPLVQSEGTWSSDDPVIEILSPNSNSSVALGLNPGNNLFFWEIMNEGCGTFSKDTLVVFFEPGAELQDDSDTTAFATPVEIFPLNNDLLPMGEYFVELTISPNQGTIEFDEEEEMFTYTPSLDFSGQDRFGYKVCPVICPDFCSDALVFVNVQQESECVVPSIITPNGDGINDALIIPCLLNDRYPENRISIFNQWGDEVYNASPYRNDWEGTFQGQQLPVGTYFFVMEFNGDKEPQSGFIVIER